MRPYNKGLIDYLRRNGMRNVHRETIETLEKVGSNLKRKAVHACNGYSTERQQKLHDTYVQKQLRIVEGILNAWMDGISEPNGNRAGFHGVKIEANMDPRGFGLKIRGLKNKNGDYVSNSSYETDVLGF